MGNQSTARDSSKLKLTHISTATKQAVQIVSNRRKGINETLITPWPKLNKAFFGGVEPQTVFTIAGISGSGKSAIANEMETGLIDLNPNVPMAVLSFNWEMVSSRQITRKFSNKMEMSVRNVMSADAPMTDVDYERVIKNAQDIAKYPIYYADDPGTADQVYNTVMGMWEDPKFTALGENRWLVVFLDHTILTKGRDSQSERAILSDLQKQFMILKKKIKVTIIQLSQMNRGIEDEDRILNPERHYPKRGDIFGGDSVYQASDYVLVSHRPEILHISSYGPDNLPVEDAVYWHLMKARDGEPQILQMKNRLEFNKIEEL